MNKIRVYEIVRDRLLLLFTFSTNVAAVLHHSLTPATCRRKKKKNRISFLRAEFYFMKLI